MSHHSVLQYLEMTKPKKLE